MQQYQTRVRKMRQHGRHHGRSTDGIRQVFQDDAIIRAKAAQQRAAQALVFITDEDGNLTDAYIDHYPDSDQESTS